MFFNKREGLDYVTYGAVFPDSLWVVAFFFDQPKYVAAINLSTFLFFSNEGGCFSVKERGLTI